MNDTQQAFLNMLLKVQDNLEDNAMAYSSHMQIAPTKVLLDAQIQNIIEAAGRATEDTTGVAADKEEDRLALEVVMYNVAKGIYSYAKDNGDNTLANKVKYTKSDLQKMQDTELHEKALRLNTYLNAVIVAALPGYNVSLADIANLPLFTEAYFEVIPEVKDAIEGKTIGGNDVDRGIAESRKLLERLDNYVDSYRNNVATVALWEEYQLARAIDDNPSGGGGNVFTGTVNAMSTHKVTEITYDAAKTLMLESTGGVSLNFALGTGGMPTGMWTSVNPGMPLNTVEGSMAASGTEILVQNNSASPAAYKVTLG